MRDILVVGAAGGYFGAHLAPAGRDVTFPVRPAREATLRECGLRIRGPDDIVDTFEVRTVTADSIDGPYALVLVAVAVRDSVRP